MRALFEFNPVMCGLTLINMVAIAWVFVPRVPVAACVWLVAAAGLLLRQLHFQRRAATRAPRPGASPRGPRLAVRAGIVVAVLWGSMPLLLLSRASGVEQLMIGVLCVGAMGLISLVLAAVPRAAIVFAALFAIQFLLGVWLVVPEAGAALTAIMATYVVAIVKTALMLGHQAARHVIDQQVIADAAAAYRELHQRLQERESRARNAIAAQVERAA